MCFRWLLLLSIFFTFTVSAEKKSYFSVSSGDNDKVDIVLNIQKKGLVSAELYRLNENNIPVNIYEFIMPENSFSEPANPGTCYFLKIYFEEGNVVETEKKCFSKEDIFKKINFWMLGVFLIFSVSVIGSIFIKRKFTDEISKSTSSMLKNVSTMLGENNGKIFFNGSLDMKCNPVFGPIIKFLKALLRSSEIDSTVETTIPVEFKAVAASEKDRRSIVFTPSLSGSNAIYSIANRRDGHIPLVFHISDGTALSDWDSYMGRNDKRKICISNTVSGANADSVLGRKCLVSVEPFLMSSQMKKIMGYKTLEFSGVYVFFVIISIIIVLGSLLSSLAEYFPAFHLFLRINGLDI